ISFLSMLSISPVTISSVKLTSSPPISYDAPILPLATRVRPCLICPSTFLVQSRSIMTLSSFLPTSGQKPNDMNAWLYEGTMTVCISCFLWNKSTNEELILLNLAFMPSSTASKVAFLEHPYVGLISSPRYLNPSTTLMPVTPETSSRNAGSVLTPIILVLSSEIFKPEISENCVYTLSISTTCCTLLICNP